MSGYRLHLSKDGSGPPIGEAYSGGLLLACWTVGGDRAIHDTSCFHLRFPYTFDAL